MRTQMKSNIFIGLAAMQLIACAKANYGLPKNQSATGVATISSNNQIIIQEGQSQYFEIVFADTAKKNQTITWKLVAVDPAINVRDRFKMISGVLNVELGSRTTKIFLTAADIDQLRQGDQRFVLEMTDSDNQTNQVQVLLKDVEPQSSLQTNVVVSEGLPRPGADRGQVAESNKRITEILAKTENGDTKVKVFFVIDNSRSMTEKQVLLASGFSNIAQQLKGKNAEFFIYTTTNDVDNENKGDKITSSETITETEKLTIKERKLNKPYQSGKLEIKSEMSESEYNQVINQLITDIKAVGTKGSKNESALCTLNQIINEEDDNLKLLNEKDKALFFILSDTEDHAKDVPNSFCGENRKVVINKTTGNIDETLSNRYRPVLNSNIIEKLNQKLGRENYAITSVGSYFDLNKNYQCGNLILDEDATIYRQLINSSPTPGSLFSICMSDYAPALKALEKFISTSISMRYEVELQEGERISDVTLLRGNVFQHLNTYDILIKKNVIQFNQRMLKEGDKLIITIRKSN